MLEVNKLIMISMLEKYNLKELCIDMEVLSFIFYLFAVNLFD